MLVSTKTEPLSTSQVERVNCQVVHRNERRIRVVVPRLGFDSAYARHLKDLVESVDYVTHVRINPAAKSIAVEYDYKVDQAKIAEAQQQVFEIIKLETYAEINELEVPVSVQQDVDYWQRLGLPITSLGVALLAGPLEVSMPFLVIAALIASAAVPIFSRAIAGVVDEGKYKVDLLDSLWITLHTLQGQYVAPALMVSLVEASEAVRDITARANQDQTLELLDSPNRSVWVERDVTDTQVGNYVKEVSDKLVVPTLFLSGSIFALTGNINGALAPLQLDFGTGIGIAVPTTILAALSSLARSGVFIRSGRALEALARTDTVVFGKTGTLTEAIGKQSADVIATLKNRGIEIHLLTGDNQQAVQAVATQLGINPNNAYDSDLPENKIEIVRRLHSEGKVVAYLGEELSDTESFTDADVSISFAKESDIESETADVVIVGNDLRQLIQAIDIAKQSMDLVYQSIALVAVPNISVVIAGIFFGLNPVTAVLINNCAALIAELNGSRPRLP